ncbi:unnamed protein product [Acidithrix sp. C25]|nr:unnamed protein product [Acidithrix sp. C25]
MLFWFAGSIIQVKIPMNLGIGFLISWKVRGVRTEKLVLNIAAKDREDSI